jgi:hypothetical protein
MSVRFARITSVLIVIFLLMKLCTIAQAAKAGLVGWPWLTGPGVRLAQMKWTSQHSCFPFPFNFPRDEKTLLYHCLGLFWIAWLALFPLFARLPHFNFISPTPFFPVSWLDLGTCLKMAPWYSIAKLRQRGLLITSLSLMRLSFVFA